MAFQIAIKTTLSRIVVLTLTLYAQNVCAQTNDLQQIIHKAVVRCYPIGEKWEDKRKMLLSHSQEELTKALLDEVDVDTRSLGEHYDRAVGIRCLYQALGLPPTSIIQELKDKGDRHVFFYHSTEKMPVPFFVHYPNHYSYDGKGNLVCTLADERKGDRHEWH